MLVNPCFCQHPASTEVGTHISLRSPLFCFGALITYALSETRGGTPTIHHPLSDASQASTHYRSLPTQTQVPNTTQIKTINVILPLTPPNDKH